MGRYSGLGRQFERMVTAAQFEEAIQPRWKALKLAALSILHDNADADDAVQDGLARAWEFREQFLHRCELGTWIYRVVINAARDMARKKRTRRYRQHVEMFDMADPKNLTLQWELSRLEKHRRDLVWGCQV